MTCRCVSYDLFQRVECKQPFRIVLLDEVNDVRKEQMKVPYRDITWQYAVRLWNIKGHDEGLTCGEGRCCSDIFLI